MRIGGYAIWTHPEKASVELDTFTCAHCNSVVFVKPKKDCGGFCRLCMAPTCGRCADKGVCTPFEKQLEAEERAARLMAAL